MMIGIEKPEAACLSRSKDRITFLYLEHCVINRCDNAITVTDATGIVHIPAASVSTLLLGPGTTITHRAIELIGDTCIAVVWVGEHGVKYYAKGQAMTRHTTYLIKQAACVTNERKHADVVRKMYCMRFPNEDVSGLTIQQLRGREGSRIRGVYKELSKKWNVPWNGREYNPDDYDSGDNVNKALSVGNACLYGIALAVITAIGCSPGLGFVHVGHEFSFAYDIADLYKAEITIPIAFEMAANPPDGDFESAVRKRIRNEFVSRKIAERMVRDIIYLLNETDEEENEYEDVLYLWDNHENTVKSGVMYGEAEDEI